MGRKILSLAIKIKNIQKIFSLKKDFQENLKKLTKNTLTSSF